MRAIPVSVSKFSSSSAHRRNTVAAAGTYCRRKLTSKLFQFLSLAKSGCDTRNLTGQVSAPDNATVVGAAPPRGMTTRPADLVPRWAA